MNHDAQNGRTIAAILADTKDELKQFIETRIALLRTELGEKVTKIKRAAPLAAVAVLMLGTAYLLFTLALVGLVLALLPANSFRWCLAFLAVAVLWSILGFIAVTLAKRRLALIELMPKRTIGVLKSDGVWIQSEVKNPL